MEPLCFPAQHVPPAGLPQARHLAGWLLHERQHLRLHQLLPAYLDGKTLPPSGSPEIFAEDGNSLGLWEFHVDWTTPGNSTFTNPFSLTTAAWTEVCLNSEDCIPQPGTTQQIDDKGD